jgi:hypothetical protein
MEEAPEEAAFVTLRSYEAVDINKIEDIRLVRMKIQAQRQNGSQMYKTNTYSARRP